MKNIKFIKEPGYTYDLTFIFFLYFNKEYCLGNFINYDKSGKDTEFLNKILVYFGPISDELVLFFRIADVEDRGRCLMTSRYFAQFRDEYLADFNSSRILEALSNLRQVVNNVLSFYFPEKEYNPDEPPSIETLNDWIKKSSLSPDIKSSLYAFFIDPASVVQRLTYELMAKEFQLSKWYEKDFSLLLELQHKFDFEAISEQLYSLTNQKANVDNFNVIYVSFCLLNKGCIKYEFYDEQALLFLGSDYTDTIDTLYKQNRIPELDVFGNALAEKNRVDILDLLLDKEEITIKDIEQILGFTGTNAYYHLSLMIKAGILRTRNKGRTVLYSLNRSHFDAVRDILKKYGSEGKKA